MASRLYYFTAAASLAICLIAGTEMEGVLADHAHANNSNGQHHIVESTFVDRHHRIERQFVPTSHTKQLVEDLVYKGIPQGNEEGFSQIRAQEAS